MIEPVGEHGVVPVEERGDDAEVGHVAGREDQRAGHADELGEPFLQFIVGGVMAADEVRRTRTHAERLRTLAGRRDEPGIGSQAEIVVRAEAEQLPPADLDAGSERTLHDPATAQQSLRLERRQPGREVRNLHERRTPTGSLPVSPRRAQTELGEELLVP